MFSKKQSGRQLPDSVQPMSQPASRSQETLATKQDEQTNAKIELRRLRKKAFKNARRLSDSENIGDLVKSVGDSLFGCIIADFPPDNPSKLTLTVWVALLACCEQTFATKPILRQLLLRDSKLVQALSKDRFNALVNRIELGRLAECGERLFSLLDN